MSLIAPALGLTSAAFTVATFVASRRLVRSAHAAATAKVDAAYARGHAHGFTTAVLQLQGGLKHDVAMKLAPAYLEQLDAAREGRQ
jgi:hypothetical protein